MEFGVVPFPLRQRKARQLSGEAMERYKAIAETGKWREAFRKCDVKGLAAALRKYDLEGYGQIRETQFRLALRDVDVALMDGLFQAMGERGRLDVEMFVEIVRYWQTGVAVEEPEEDDDWWRIDDEVALLEDRATSGGRRGALRSAIARLDPMTIGGLDDMSLAMALFDAGIATGPNTRADTLTRLAPLRSDGLHDYSKLIDDLDDTSDATWRCAATAWRRVRVIIEEDDEMDAAQLQSLLHGVGGRLGPSDFASLWRKLGSSTVTKAKVDALFCVEPEVPPPVIQRRREPAPFAKEDDDSAWRIGDRKSTLKSTQRTNTDESRNEWPETAAELIKSRAQTVASSKQCTQPPPYWTHDLEEDQQRQRQRKRPEPKRCPFFRQYDDDDGCAVKEKEKLPALARRLRRAAAVADDAVLRSALSLAVGPRIGGTPALERFQLQALAQHFGTPFSNGELEILARWVETVLVMKQEILTTEDCARELLDVGFIDESSKRKFDVDRQLAFETHRHAVTRAQSRVLRYAAQIAARCEGADPERTGLVAAGAFDAAIRDPALLPDSVDRADLVKSLTRSDGRVSYTTLAADLERLQQGLSLNMSEEEDEPTTPTHPSPPEPEVEEERARSPPPPPSPPPPRPPPVVVVECEEDDKENSEPLIKPRAGLKPRDHEPPREQQDRPPKDVRASLGQKVRASPALAMNNRGITAAAAARLRRAFRRQAGSNRDTIFQRLVARGDVDDVLDVEAGAAARVPDVARVLRDLGIPISEAELDILVKDVAGFEYRPQDDDARTVPTNSIITYLHRLSSS